MTCAGPPLLAAMRLIRAELPETRVVMITMSAEDKDLFDAIKGGASGYLLKTQDTEEFFSLLAEVERGEIALSPGLATRMLEEFRKDSALAASIAMPSAAAALSHRETQVLTLVAQGLTYKERSPARRRRPRTVKIF